MLLPFSVVSHWITSFYVFAFLWYPRLQIHKKHSVIFYFCFYSQNDELKKRVLCIPIKPSEAECEISWNGIVFKQNQLKTKTKWEKNFYTCLPRGLFLVRTAHALCTTCSLLLHWKYVFLIPVVYFYQTKRLMH